METPTLQALTTSAGIAVLVLAINQILWQVTGASDALKARFGPLVAGLTGVVAAIGAGAVLGSGGADLVQIGLNGFFGGLAAAGLYDLVKSKAGVAPASPEG